MTGSEQPGDLVFFGSPAYHVGIYVGGGSMVNAPHTGTMVSYGSVAGAVGVRPAASPERLGGRRGATSATALAAPVGALAVAFSRHLCAVKR